MRGPPPGTPKTPGSGRKKGTSNKVNVQTREALWQAIARLEAQGIEANPFLVLLTTMVSTADEHVRLHAATALADRLLPKLKSTELTTDPDRPPVFQVTLETRLAQALSQLETARNGSSPDDHQRGFPGEVLR